MKLSIESAVKMSGSQTCVNLSKKDLVYVNLVPLTKTQKPGLVANTACDTDDVLIHFKNNYS